MPDEKRLDLFAYDTEIFPNLTGLKVPGHTPGHTVFQLKDRYFVGDIVHAAALQMVHPTFCARYDAELALRGIVWKRVPLTKTNLFRPGKKSFVADKIGKMFQNCLISVRKSFDAWL